MQRMTLQTSDRTTRSLGLAPQRRSGFTLLELLIVLAIILVIAAMVVPNLVGTQQGSQIKAAQILVKQVEGVTKNYAVDHDGSYFVGSGQEVWSEFVNPAPYRGNVIRPYYEENSIPVDPWGSVLAYEWDGNGHSKAPNALKPAIWSFGPNKQDDAGGGDDINNWTSNVTPQ